MEKEQLLTEAEVEALNQHSASSDPLTATAAAEARVDRVEAGTRSPESGQPGSGYALEGSLAKELALEKGSGPSQAPNTVAASQET